MVVHPPSTSHRALDAAALAAAGITEGLLRVSVGLEDEADLRADLRARSTPRGARPTGHRRRPIATLAAGRSARPPGPARTRRRRLGNAVWGLLTSVDFAVLQIIVLALLAVVGMTLRQLPDFAFRSSTDYANEMGSSMAGTTRPSASAVVDALERLQLFQVFTLDLVQHRAGRSHRLDRRLHPRPTPAPVAPVGRHPGRPARPVLRPAPSRSGRGGGARGRPAVAGVLRRHRFRVRREARPPGSATCTAIGNRWTKLATLLTHAGLVLFLVAAAVTSRFGDEQGLVVADGESLTVQPIGTPGPAARAQPGLRGARVRDRAGRPTSRPTSPCTRTAARSRDKVIRVNDPLTVGGYTFHQNGFGPAPDVVIRDAAGRPLWSGPVPMTDEAAGFPLAEIAVPGPRHRAPDAAPARRGRDGRSCWCSRSGRSAPTPTARRRCSRSSPWRSPPARQGVAAGTDFSVELRGFAELHAPHRQEGPRAGDRVGRVRAADRRARDHVLDAAPPGLGPARPDGAASFVASAPTATWTSIASSGVPRRPRRRATGAPRPSRAATGPRVRTSGPADGRAWPRCLVALKLRRDLLRRRAAPGTPAPDAPARRLGPRPPRARPGARRRSSPATS